MFLVSSPLQDSFGRQYLSISDLFAFLELVAKSYIALPVERELSAFAVGCRLVLRSRRFRPQFVLSRNRLS